MSRKIFLIAIVALLGLASCEQDKDEPQLPRGKTFVSQDFERLAAKNDMAMLDGWLNIMRVDTTYTQPYLCWQGALDGCNVVAQASAHKYDDSNAGIRYESWLISPPLDVSSAASKKLSFKVMAAYWQTSDSLDVFFLRSLQDISSGKPMIAPKGLNLPTRKEETNTWFVNNLNLSNIEGVILVGFRYRALGGKSMSTSYALDDFAFGDVPAQSNPTIFEEPFAGDLGKFTQLSVNGAQRWQGNTNASSAPYAVCVKISGYANKKNNANEDWLISPAIDLSSAESAQLRFEHSLNMGSTNADTIAMYQQVLVSTDLTNAADVGSVSAATWEQLDVTYPIGSSWSFVCASKIDLSKYLGKSNVRIAFRYVSTEASCANWGIKNVRISKK